MPWLRRCADARVLTAVYSKLLSQVSISDLTEDIVTFSKHKNPSVKEQTMRFLVRCLRNTTSAIPKADVKPISDLLLGGLEDAVVPVRDAAAEGLGTMMKLVGRASFEPTLQGLDDIKKARVQEYFEKAEIKFRAGKAGGVATGSSKTAPATIVSKPMARAPSKPKPTIEKENEPVAPSSPIPRSAAKPPARLMAKKPPVAAAPPPPAAKKAAAAPAPAVVAAAKAPAAGSSSVAKPLEPVKFKMSQEDAEGKAPEVFPGTFVDDIGNSVWKTRLAAMDSLLEWLPTNASQVEAEVIVRYLNKKPGPKESNFQVRSGVFVPSV